MSPKKPNILLICTDQQRFDALGASGNPHIHTPNLDKLARQGVRFDRCYVQSPVCAPSRASLMTSRYLHNHGLWANGVDISPSEELFTKVLADAGYDCGLVGKFHLGAAQNGRTEPRIEDGFRIFKWAHDPYERNPDNKYHNWLNANFPGLLEESIARGHDAIDKLPTESHYSHWIGEETIEFLRTTREHDKPFCFVVNFFDPHHGFGAPDEYRALYDASSLPAPVTSDDDLTTKPAIYSEASKKSYAGTLPGYQDFTAEEIQEIKAQYYAMVSLLDNEVGRILATLDDEGLGDDTIVVFTSDHGELLGDHQMLLKGPMMFDCSVRVPLILRWNDHLPKNEVREEIVEWIDIAPTLLSFAGVGGLRRGQGRNLAELVQGTDSSHPRDWALSEYRNSCIPYEVPVHTTMLRQGDWKVVVHHGEPSTTRERDGELYNLACDPDELVNLWHVPEALLERIRMEGRLLDVLVATEDRSRERISDY
ncbi:sulfatase-like hydrolase/transferase [Glaciihabitans sp. UYNi722]|uniref:sulfatase family protein n=1 Tax=Glaciihabitans sp. UYNi722 TaxID=3156344 RepID=UPI003396A9F3